MTEIQETLRSKVGDIIYDIINQSSSKNQKIKLLEELIEWIIENYHEEHENTR
jgi:iron-sulfur cluster repair protein YtfE (RIC family)